VRERERVRLTGGARRQRESGGRDEGARVVGPSWAMRGAGGGGGRGHEWEGEEVDRNRPNRGGERGFSFFFLFSL
jgi:hypothetical protein